MNTTKTQRATSRLKSARPKMPISERAKQFQPFAALAGLEDAFRRKEEEKEKEG